MILKKLI